jgi:hypothetical protein
MHTYWRTSESTREALLIDLVREQILEILKELDLTIPQAGKSRPR